MDFDYSCNGNYCSGGHADKAVNKGRDEKMIAIIPNWHPIFVHFTVALFSTSTGFYLLHYITRYIKKIPLWLNTEFEIVARWCVWIASLITIATVSFGFYAYYTVKHDAVSHLAMTTHRNWAIITALFIILLGFWSIQWKMKKINITLTFILTMLIAQGLLLTTAWHGGELVYRYGLGVMSLPTAEEVGHQHNHE